MNEVKRDSSFELVRLLAQYMIVVYHILYFWFWVYTDKPDVLLRALYMPLHIGVPVFVCLSGYFHIKFSLKGIARIAVYLLLYEVGLRFLGNTFFPGYVLESHNIWGTSDASRWKQIFFISGTDAWFIRTYLMLFMVSPMINKYIDTLSAKNRVCLIIFLAWICLYIPELNLDPSLADGKNLPTFILFYVIGDTISKYKNKWKEWNTTFLVFVYLLFNISIAVSYYLFYTKGFIGVSENLYRLVFYYYSPVLLINAVLFIMIFTKKPYYNPIINRMAKSSLAIYLMHGSFVFMFVLARPASIWIQSNIQNEMLVIILVFGLGLIITFACIVIDQILTPLTNLLSKWFTRFMETFLGCLTKDYC